MMTHMKNLLTILLLLLPLSAHAWGVVVSSGGVAAGGGGATCGGGSTISEPSTMPTGTTAQAFGRGASNDARGHEFTTNTSGGKLLSVTVYVNEPGTGITGWNAALYYNNSGTWTLAATSDTLAAASIVDDADNTITFSGDNQFCLEPSTTYRIVVSSDCTSGSSVYNGADTGRTACRIATITASYPSFDATTTFINTYDTAYRIQVNYEQN